MAEDAKDRGKTGGKGTPPRGKPFEPGKRTAGRQKGTLNHATVEVKELAGNLIRDEEYQRNLLIRLRDGTLPPAVETMLWHYHYGKPRESVEITGPGGRPLSGPQVMLYMPDNGRAIAAPEAIGKGEVPVEVEESPHGEPEG